MRIASRKVIATALMASAATAGAVVATVTASITPAAPALSAVVPLATPCSQHSCDGLDPTLSYLLRSNPRAFCSAGARNVSDLPGGKRVLGGGLLEMRWGPNCQTNWTRFTSANNDKYKILIVSSDGTLAGNGLNNGYTFSGAKGVAHYSDQVWSPGPAGAYVYDLTTGQEAFYVQKS